MTTFIQLVSIKRYVSINKSISLYMYFIQLLCIWLYLYLTSIALNNVYANCYKINSVIKALHIDLVYVHKHFVCSVNASIRCQKVSVLCCLILYLAKLLFCQKKLLNQIPSCIYSNISTLRRPCIKQLHPKLVGAD